MSGIVEAAEMDEEEAVRQLVGPTLAFIRKMPDLNLPKPVLTRVLFCWRNACEESIGEIRSESQEESWKGY